MAIQPIDLQTLFTQLDKVAKTQSEQKEGVQIQQALQGEVTVKKTEEKTKTVNEPKNTGEGVEKINDKLASKSYHKFQKKKNPQEEHEDNEESEVVQDPDLGKNIDIDG